MSTPSNASGVASLISWERPVDRDGPPGRPAGGKQAQLPDREFPLVEDLDHRPADDAGGADDRDGEGLPCHVGHGSAITVRGPGTGGV